MKAFLQNVARLGESYDIDIEVTSKPRADYNTDEYFALDLPVAPAIMVGDEIITEGKALTITRSRWQSAVSWGFRNLRRKESWTGCFEVELGHLSNTIQAGYRWCT